MNDTTWTIPKDIETESLKRFKPLVYADAVKLLKLSRTMISFSRGNTETYFIVSGIIRDNRTHESKVTYKKRLDNAPTGPVSSSCDCHFWTPEEHCPHSASLYVAYLSQLKFDGLGENFQLDSSPPISLKQSIAVNPLKYGTLIPNANQLMGAAPSSVWSSMQYMLHDKRVLNFPLPEKLEGKLILNYISETKDNLASIQWLLEYEDHTLESKINVLEHLYIFDWKRGRAFHIPNQLKLFVQQVRRLESPPLIDDLLKLINKDPSLDHFSLHIDGCSMLEIKREELSARLSFLPNNQRKLVAVEFEFFNADEVLAPAPEFLRAFTFGHGFLSHFKKKRDGYNFSTAIADFLLDRDPSYKKSLIGIKKKYEIQQTLDRLTESEFSIQYDSNRKVLQTFNNDLLKNIFITLARDFGSLLFRFSSYSLETKIVRYEIPASNLFQGIAAVQKRLVPFGIQFFYNRDKITSWTSKVRFERKRSNTKWFNLTLNVNNLDLEIIKQADLETGVALTKNGLIILTSEQKDLMRFMKRYVNYEGTEEEKRKEKNGDNEKGHQFVLPFNRARIFELFELKKLGIEGALTQEEEKLCERLSTIEEVPQYPLPKEMQNVLRSYQKTGYQWLRFLHENKLGACLADDMGLGKTLQAITFIQSIYDEIDKVLIVCPVSILINWEKEFQKFSNINVHIYHGNTRSIPKDRKIILTSYGVMKREVDDTFSNMEFDILVLDEVQHLKNIRSLGAFAVRKLKADFRICLTGTPVENDLAEFYNIMDLSIPGIWGDLQFIRTTSNKKSRLLARKTASPFILRRTKGQVLSDLPPKLENNVFLEMQEIELLNYKQNLEDIKKRILVASSRQKYGEILRGLLKLRQLCLWQSPKNLLPLRNRKRIYSTKIDFLLQTLEQIIEEGHQAIVFSQFTTYLDIIQNEIHEKHWKFSRIDGSQAMKRRQKEVDSFQDGSNRIFLISLKAGGVGLNLTAASYVFIMDPWWNPAVEAQAIDRAHRIGQQNKLTVYRPIIKNSVEEKVIELQQVKRELFEDLLQNNDNSELFSGKLSMQDFEHLFT